MLFMACVCHVFASVHCCLVVTCWERADLFALDCDVKLCFCPFPHVLSWVRCGIRLYRFLIFATFLTYSITNGLVSSKLYNERHNLYFKIGNSPFLDGDIPHSPSYGVYISQLLEYVLMLVTSTLENDFD